MIERIYAKKKSLPVWQGRFITYIHTILHQLDSLGINEKTLFPGLDGIGRYIERRYRFDYNEHLNNV